MHFKIQIEQLIVHRDIEKISARNPVVTVGIFDGVHLGHQYIIEKLIAAARERDGESVVVTLWPHPREVLNHSTNGVRLITTLREKEKILSQFAIDHMVILAFTREFSQQSYCDFVSGILVEKLSINHLIMGFNHRFGKNREGNIENIRKCASQYNFTVDHLEPFIDGGRHISSSVIRQVLSEGDIKQANKYLGYPFMLSGKVSGGSKVGRSIGFPTANIIPDDPRKLIPGVGVYAVEVIINDQVHKGMLNIGTRPTVNTNPDKTTIEVHIIDFDGDIYGQNIGLRFINRIRDEMKFGSVEELRLQLIKDKKITLELLYPGKD